MSSQEAQFLLYYKGQYRGPFDESIIIEELNQSNIGKDLSVWNEELAEWLAIEQTPQFQGYESLLAEQTQLSQDIETRQSLRLPAMQLHTLEILEEEKQQINKDTDELVSGAPMPSEAEALPNKSWLLFIQQSRVARWSILLSLIAGVFLVSKIQSYRRQLELEPIFHRLDASYSEIQQAKEVLLNKTGSAPIVLREKASKESSPILRLFVNLPDHSQVLFKLTGIRKTLVGALFHQAQTDVIVREKMAGTGPLLNAAGQPLPPGYYSAELTCLNCRGEMAQPLKVSTPIAIGIDDLKTYKSNLSQFHQLVRSQAASEVIEIGEIIKLFKEIVVQKKTLSAQKGPFQQLDQVLKGITEEVARDSYVYGSLYLDLKAIQNLINRKQWKNGAEALFTLQDKLRSLQQSPGPEEFL